MRIHLLSILLSLVAITVAAQNNRRPLMLRKGEAFEAEVRWKNEMIMEMASIQHGSFKDVRTWTQFTVSAAADTGFGVHGVDKRMVFVSGVGKDTILHTDSDNKQSMINTLFKKDGQGQIGKTVAYSINRQGIITASVFLPKPGESATSDPTTASGSVQGAGARWELAASLPNKRLRVGLKWADSLLSDQYEEVISYEITKIGNGLATIVGHVRFKQSGKQTVGANAMSTNLSGTGKVLLIVEMASGMVQRRDVAIEASGMTETMGQTIPLKQRLIKVLTVRRRQP